jgi:predicted secreted protein
MNTTKHGMRTVLAATAAGALVLGSAAGVATAKPAKTAPVPTIKTISIKGHAPIDLATVTAETKIKLRASVRDGSKTATTEKVVMTLGVYTKKVRGQVVPGSIPSASVNLVSTSTTKTKRFAGDAVLATIWDANAVNTLKTALKPGDRAYICIASADLQPSTTEQQSKIVKKRLSTVRDCVKVIDTTPETTS